PPSFACGQRDPIPLGWLTPVGVMEIAARRPRAPVGATKPSGIEHHRIASLAQRTDLRAPPPGIEGVVTPFDLCDASHRFSPESRAARAAQNVLRRGDLRMKLAQKPLQVLARHLRR